jgi:hypothetical protein
VWTVDGALVTVDKFDGVRSWVSMVVVQTVTQTQKSSEPKTVAVQILGALLKQRSSSESQQQAPQPKTVLFTRDDVGDIKILDDLNFCTGSIK